MPLAAAPGGLPAPLPLAAAPGLVAAALFGPPPGAPSCPYGDRTHVWPGRPAVGLAVVGLVVPGRVGARGVELAWGHVFTAVLVVCACE